MNDCKQQCIHQHPQRRALLTVRAAEDADVAVLVHDSAVAREVAARHLLKVGLPADRDSNKPASKRVR